MYVKLDVGDDDVRRDMDVRETYIQSTASGDFWSELARGSEVVFQPEEEI